MLWFLSARALIAECYSIIANSGEHFLLEQSNNMNDLRDWIAALERAGDLKRIRAEVDLILEITEIADRVSKGAAKAYGRPGGPALLFENVKGGNGIPVLINQFGSERRMQMALGVERLDEIAERIRQLLNMKSPEGFLEKLKMLPMLADMGKFFPKTVP